ncbi:hypothetical protein AKJ43_02950 [candidate division MSBL1 archaeon SCGC-AAA261D19]|uniref:DNA primase/nucleoside triphosphatase C-terminal domain-containing protein n=1 Tax=candidate division MSBL1 archaeon SCGC-AAA261D19 TaxID=1698273 RepID=A0A133V622_9EURY|nr:hypothetical protein AKJ43_02950 [candidate division MSBL1 archaeon SCGC-AAA261D19]
MGGDEQSNRAFVNEELETEPTHFGTKDEIYRAYVKFCHERNTPPLDKNVFSRKLQKHVSVEKYHPKIDGKQVKCWKGVSLKSNIRDIRDKSDFKDINKPRKLVTDFLEQTPLDKPKESVGWLRPLAIFGGANSNIFKVENTPYIPNTALRRVFDVKKKELPPVANWVESFGEVRENMAEMYLTDKHGLSRGKADGKIDHLIDSDTLAVCGTIPENEARLLTRSG